MSQSKYVRLPDAFILAHLTLSIARFFAGSKSHVFNAGAPVWGLDWCPMYADDRARTQTIPSSSTNLADNTNADHQHKQYLAVAPFPSRNYSPMIGSRVQRPSHASIQIWSLSPSKPVDDAMDVDGAGPSNAAPCPPDDAGEMHCEMVLCVESGPAFELKWCPLPSNDPVAVRTISSYLQSAAHSGYRAQAVPETSRESLVS